jgi:hypothetical protein
VRIVFDRGFGPFTAGVPYDVPGPLAELHIRLCRARKVKPEPKEPEASKGKAPRRR